MLKLVATRFVRQLTITPINIRMLAPRSFSYVSHRNPNDDSYRIITSMIQAYADQGELQKMRACYIDLKRCGYKVSPDVVCSLISAYGKAGKTKDMEQIYEDWRYYTGMDDKIPPAYADKIPPAYCALKAAAAAESSHEVEEQQPEEKEEDEKPAPKYKLAAAEDKEWRTYVVPPSKVIRYEYAEYNMDKVAEEVMKNQF